MIVRVVISTALETPSNGRVHSWDEAEAYGTLLALPDVSNLHTAHFSNNFILHDNDLNSQTDDPAVII